VTVKSGISYKNGWLPKKKCDTKKEKRKNTKMGMIIKGVLL
jgi:hypothetical protein